MSFKRHGFSLVEVVLALGIFTFVVVSMVGVLSLGLKTNQETQEECEAVNLLAAVIQDMRHTPVGSSKSVIFGLSSTPYQVDNVIGRVQEAWFDEGWELQLGKDSLYRSKFKVEWWYVRVPDKKSLAAVESVFRVSWPPRPHRTFGSGLSEKRLEKFEIYASFLNHE
jgi:hypothetical protein